MSESVERCLRAVLRVAFPEGLLSVPEGCLDGFSFEVVVHRREPYRGVRAWCNLGDGLEVLGPSGEHPGRSLSELAETAVEAGSPLNPVFRIGFALLEVSLAGAEAEQSAAADRGRITVQRSSRFLGGPGC